MTAKQTLMITTPVGAFTRMTNSPYTHAVVRTSPRAAEVFAEFEAGRVKDRSGVDGRWVKDRGYAVTWHMSEAAAKRAAEKGYTWDLHTTVVGVYAVDAGGWEPVTEAEQAAIMAAEVSAIRAGKKVGA